MIFVTSDHAGFRLKTDIIKFFSKNDIIVNDMGCYSDDAVDYPDYAFIANEKIADNEENVGIYICGTGIGMSIAANRNSLIRAALCYNKNFASIARRHNDANVLVLPGRFLSKKKAISIIKTFLTTRFESGRHLKRVQKLGQLIL